MTDATRAVLRAFLAEPSAELYGLEIGSIARLAPGTIQPILVRFEALGWLTSRWEQLDPSQAGRPRRRYYRFAPHGAELARDALLRAEQRRARTRRFEPLRLPGLEGGAT